MTSSPSSQLAMHCGCQELDEDSYQANDSTVDGRNLERVLLFDENSAFASKYASLPSTDLLPPLSEVLGESTQPHSPAGSYTPIQRPQTECHPQNLALQRTVSIPKIVIKCEESVITVDPHHQNSKHRPARSRHQRTDDNYSFLLPTLSPNCLQPRKLLEPHNPKSLTLRGENRGQNNVSALFRDYLPQLYTKTACKRPNVTELGDAGDTGTQENVFEGVLKHAHKDKITKRNMGRQKVTTDGVENDEYGNLPSTAKDTKCKRLLTSTAPKRQGKRSRNDPRSHTFTWRQQEPRDHLNHGYNNIGAAFHDNSTKDAFSPLSGNLTSDLRHHISRMSDPSSMVNAKRGIQYPGMHLYDVMRTNRNHDRMLYKNSSPVPIAEGIDLSTLFTPSSEHELISTERERGASEWEDLKEECQLIIDLEDDANERKSATAHDKDIPVQHGRHQKMIQDITEELCEGIEENVIKNGILPVNFEHHEHMNNLKGKSLQRQELLESYDIGAGDTLLENSHIDDKNQMDIDFLDVSEHRIENTKKVGDGYEHTTEIRYNAPGSTDQLEGEAGVEKVLSCASWKVPENKDIKSLSMSTSQLHTKTTPSWHRRYVPNLSKSIVPTKELVSVYSPKKLSETSMKIPKHNTQRRIVDLPVPVKHNTWTNEDIKPKVDTGLRKNKSTPQIEQSEPKVPQPEPKLQQPELELQQRQNIQPASLVNEKDPRIIPWETVDDFTDDSFHSDINMTFKSCAVIPPSKSYITNAEKLTALTKSLAKDEEEKEKDSEEEEAEYRFMRRIKARVLRMRKVLPPPSPTKLCFFVTNSTRNHKDIIEQIEKCSNVKVTSLQYDPVYIARCGKGGNKSMWIFEMTPDSDKNFILSYGLKIDNQAVTVRPLDDVYKEEHRTYQMYHAVRVEQKQKMLTTKRRKINL